ncbi:multidrug efflux SMR transporter [Labrenzia sp. R4_1]|uniref:DMT family transporter n=1 Tax=Labrenzia sp. R4_1 TaxID=2821106 RepID=UPI00336A55D4
MNPSRDFLSLGHADVRVFPKKSIRDDPSMETNMAWVLLLLAGLLEIIWAYAMKQSHGFSRLLPTLVMALAMAGSFGLLAVSMRSLPLGTAYMIWTGIGAIGAFAVGVWVLGEAITPQRLIAALLIVAGMVTMKLS